MPTNGCCQVEAATWPLVGSLFDIYDVIEQDTFLPRGWTCVSCVAHGDEPGLTFAYVTLDLSADRAICTQTVTINPLEEEAEEDGRRIVEELPEILLQVVAKRHSAKKSSTNFLVTHIKSVADLRRLLTDESTYVASADDATTAGAAKGVDVVDDEDVSVEEGTNVEDARGGGGDDDDGETIEIEEEVDDEESESRSMESSDGGMKAQNAAERKVAKKSTTPAAATKKRGGSADDGEGTDSGGKKKKPDPKPKLKNGIKLDPGRPFQCLECDASFKYRNHFKDHLRVHTDDTFQCPLCDYQTKLQAPFTTHMTDRHGSGTYRCSDHGTRGCDQVFQRLHDLARHLPKDHGIDTGFKLHHYDPKKGALKEMLCDQAQTVPTESLPKRSGGVKAAMASAASEVVPKPKAAKKTTGKSAGNIIGKIADSGGRPDSPGDAGSIRILATYPTLASTPTEIPVLSAQFHEAQSNSHYGPHIHVGGSFDLDDVSATSDELPVIRNIEMSDFQMTQYELNRSSGFSSPAQSLTPQQAGFSTPPRNHQTLEGSFDDDGFSVRGQNSFEANATTSVECQPVIIQDMVSVSLTDDYLDSTEGIRHDDSTSTSKKPEKPATGSKRGEANLGKPLENMPSVEDSPSSRGRQRFQRKVYEASVQEAVKRIKLAKALPTRTQSEQHQTARIEATPVYLPEANFFMEPRNADDVASLSILSLPPPPPLPPATHAVNAANAANALKPESTPSNKQILPDPYVKLTRLPPELLALLLAKLPQKKVKLLPKLLPKQLPKLLPKPSDPSDLSKPAPKPSDHRVTKTNVVFTPTGHNRCDDVEDPSNEWLSRYDMSCQSCNVVRFETESSFQSHQRTVHNVDRPWICQSPGCSSSFRQIPHYREHIRGTHHPDIKVFKCIFCDYRCCTASQLTTHRAKSHSTFACPKCSNKFNSDRSLREHQSKRNHYAPGEKPPEGGFFEGFGSDGAKPIVKESARDSNRGSKSKSGTPKLSASNEMSPVAFIVESFDANIQAENDFQMQSFPDFYGAPMETSQVGVKKRKAGRGGKEAPPAVKRLQDLNEEFEKCNDLLDDFF